MRLQWGAHIGQFDKDRSVARPVRSWSLNQGDRGTSSRGRPSAGGISAPGLRNTTQVTNDRIYQTQWEYLPSEARAAPYSTLVPNSGTAYECTVFDGESAAAQRNSAFV